MNGQTQEKAQRPRMTLRRKLFVAILLFSLATIVLCTAVTILGVGRMGDRLVRSNEELNGEFLPVLRSGFSQAEIYQWKLLTEIGRGAVPEKEEDSYKILESVRDRLSGLIAFDREILFLVQDGNILAALTGREPVPMTQDEVAEHLRQTIESDPASYEYPMEEGTTFPGVLEMSTQMSTFMSYSKERGKDALLLISPLRGDTQIGILTTDSSAVRWMEALYEIQERSAASARETAEKEMRYLLIALILVILFLTLTQVLAAMGLTRFLADPVEQEKQEQERKLNAIEEERRDLLEINRLRTESLGNISHELKAPLTVVGLYVEECQSLLHQGVDDANLQKMNRNMRIVLAEANRLTLLITQMLELSSLEERPMALHLQKVSLLKVTQDVLNTFYPILSLHGNTLTMQRENAIPLVNLDEGKIRQVLINILNNAAYHTREGKIVISLSEVAQGVRCEIRDNGEGIAPEDLPHIFERFYRKETGSEKNTGTGIGLYISKMIIEAHGGRIGAQSEPGKGTCIWFTIPGEISPSETDTSSPE